MNTFDFENQHDNDKIYCRKLGHDVNFGYCRKESITDPCSRIVRCWIEQMDITNYLEQKYGAAFVDDFTGRESKDKITSIIEILEKEKKRTQKEN